MFQTMPDFNPEPAIEQPSPKKPRRKPTKRKAKIAAAPKPARRKRRTVKRIAPATNNHGGRFTPEVYRLIGALMGLDPATRNLVIEVAKGLSR